MASPSCRNSWFTHDARARFSSSVSWGRDLISVLMLLLKADAISAKRADRTSRALAERDPWPGPDDSMVLRASSLIA